ncbi:MAG TPA: hypothetical protein VIB11_00105 [Pedococcus sp.]|uniref:hypothetical protein n=1 Tax=Pedococcus sp. TaxID=2860345 RepID=UPI002F91E1A7
MTTLTAHPYVVAAELSWRRENLAGAGLRPERRHRRLSWPTWRPSRPRRSTATLRPA